MARRTNSYGVFNPGRSNRVRDARRRRELSDLAWTISAAEQRRRSERQEPNSIQRRINLLEELDRMPQYPDPHEEDHEAQVMRLRSIGLGLPNSSINQRNIIQRERRDIRINLNQKAEELHRNIRNPMAIWLVYSLILLAMGVQFLDYGKIRNFNSQKDCVPNIDNNYCQHQVLESRPQTALNATQIETFYAFEDKCNQKMRCWYASYFVVVTIKTLAVVYNYF